MRVLNMVESFLCVKNEEAALLRKYMHTFGQRGVLTPFLIGHRLYLLGKMKELRHA
jgi:hypothetical protein